MKKTSRLFFLFVAFVLLGLTILRAQEKPEEFGFLTFVNAIGDDGQRTFLSLDAMHLREKGFGPGQATSGMGFPAGTKKIKIEHGDAKPLEIPITLVATQSQTLAVYLETITDPTTGKILHNLKATTYAAKAGKNLELVGIYLSTKPSTTVISAGQAIILPRLQETILPIKQTEAEVKLADGSAYNNSFESGGRQMLFIFENVDGKMGTVLAYGSPYSAH